MRVLRQFIATSFSLIVLPFFGYLLARQIDHRALLVGGYLLVSPLIALWVGAYFSGLLGWRSNKSKTRPSAADQILVESIAAKSGIEMPRLDAVILPSSKSGAVFDFETNCLNLIQPTWGNLSRAAQEFAVARAIAENQDSRQRIFIRELLKWIALLVCSAICSLNLWLILLIQSGSVASIVCSGIAKHRARLLRIDATALDRCENSNGAKEWINLQTDFPTLSVVERIQLLEAAGAQG